MQARKVICLGLSLIFTILTSRAQERPTQTSARMGPSQGGEINSNHGNAPLTFEANQGQSDSQVKFLSHGNGYSVFLTAGGMILALRLARPSREGKSAVLAIDLVGAATNPIIVGEEPLSTKITRLTLVVHQTGNLAANQTGLR